MRPIQLLDSLPIELLLDILGLYLPPSLIFNQLISLNSKYSNLIKSDSLCKRQLVQLNQSISHLYSGHLSLSIKQWPGFDSLLSLFRSLCKFIHLLGHWRLTDCYLGQIICFSLDIVNQSIVGTHVDHDITIRLIVIDLLNDRPSQAFYLQNRSIRHPCSIKLHRSSIDQSINQSINHVIDARLIDFTAPVLSSSVDRSQVQSFSITCSSLPSRDRAQEIIHLQHLGTPVQRRYFPLYYPNPQSIIRRLTGHPSVPPASHPSTPPDSPFPPAGLYVGDYGPHGAEVMQIEYDCERREMIAWKVLGDANVPAGKVSFRISLPDDVWPGMLSRARPDDLTILPVDSDDDDDDSVITRVAHFRRPHVPRLAPVLPVLAMHSGRGTIASRGFENPQTVDVHCFFHANARFTLEFLGFIVFKPWQCPRHNSDDDIDM